MSTKNRPNLEVSDANIGNFHTWYTKVEKAVEEKGFEKAFEEYLPQIAYVHFSDKYDETLLGERLHGLIVKDPQLREALDNLPQEEKQLLNDYLEHGEGEGDGFDSLKHEDFVAALSRQQMSGQPMPDIFEEDETSVCCLTQEAFENWGKTVHNAPYLTCIPKTKVGVCNIVKWAKENNKTVRVSGYRHTWSNLYSNDDQVLISILPPSLALDLPAEHPPIDPNNQLQGIELVGEAFDEGDVRKHLCKIGVATTNEQFRQWCIGLWKEGIQDLWTLPLNVIVTEITFGGSNAPICHGAGWGTQTLSDLVTEIEFVNANGELQTVNDPKQLKVASGCFGLLGVVTSLTLKLDKMTFANMIPVKKPVVLTVPPLNYNLSLVPGDIDTTDITRDEMEAGWQDFIDRCENDYYTEWFWYPYQQESWINTWNNDGDPSKAEDYPSELVGIVEPLLLYILELLNNSLFQILPGKFQARVFGTSAMLAMPDRDPSDPIVTPLIDALHFQRGIHNMRVFDMELEIPIPADPSGKPDWTICQKAWWDAINEFYNWSPQNDQPMRVALEMRITRDSNVTMAPQYGNSWGTCSIEVLTTGNTNPNDWEDFMQKVADRWNAYSYTDATGTHHVRPHWAKQWQNIEFNRKNAIEYLKTEAYKDRIPEFKAGLQSIAQAGGYTIDDLQDLFSNPTLDDLIFDEEELQGGSFQIDNRGGYVARFSVTYNLKGKKYRKESGDFPFRLSRSLNIPAGATDIVLKVEKAVFIGVWRSIFKKAFPEPITKRYKVWGVTWKSQYREIDS